MELAKKHRSRSRKRKKQSNSGLDGIDHKNNLLLHSNAFERHDYIEHKTRHVSSANLRCKKKTSKHTKKHKRLQFCLQCLFRYLSFIIFVIHLLFNTFCFYSYMNIRFDDPLQSLTKQILTTLSPLISAVISFTRLLFDLTMTSI